MKTLLLARHGEAEDLKSGLSDFNRKLTKRGVLAVTANSAKLKSFISPNLIVSSPANRAFQTAKIHAETFKISDSQILKIESIYESSLLNLLKLINETDNSYDTILIVGHNPAFEYAIGYLCNYNIREFSTSAITIIEFPFEDWANVSEGTGQLKNLILPF